MSFSISRLITNQLQADNIFQLVPTELTCTVVNKII